MRFILATLLLVAFVNAVPLAEEAETSTRGRHGEGHETSAPHTQAPHTDLPPHTTEPPHTTPPAHTDAPTTPPAHTDAPTTPPPTHVPTHGPTQSPTHGPTHGPSTEAPWTATVIEGGKEYHVTCTQEGPMAHPGNVHKYIICEYQADHKHWHITVMPCAIGTRWHQAIKNCIQDN